ncbi:MAG: hypothetical protein RLZ84_468 [Actinomycetota bacterium]
MNALTSLVAKSWYDHRRGTIGWMVGIVGLVILQLSVYPSIRDSATDWSNLAETLPEVFREMLRVNDYASETGYLSAELFSFTIPLIFVGIGMTWGARNATEEEADGTADILYSMPIRRRSLLLADTLSGLAVVLTQTAAFSVSLIIGSRILDMSIPLVRLVQAPLACGLLGAVFLAIANVIGAVSGKKSVSLGVTTFGAIALFVAYSLAPLVHFFDVILPYNPFRWTIGTTPLTEGLDIGQMLLCLTASGLLLASSTWLFERRDIAS